MAIDIMANVLVPLAEGFEEIEAVSVIDVLRRAGANVVVAGLPGTIIKGSRGLNVIADTKLEDVDTKKFDAIVLPGGDPGYKNLGRSQKLLLAIQDFESEGKLVAAICAAPVVLAKTGILDNRKASIHPGMEKEITFPRPDRVTIDNKVITSQGPGTAIEFSLRIVEELFGRAKSEELKKKLVA